MSIFEVMCTWFHQFFYQPGIVLHQGQYHPKKHKNTFHSFLLVGYSVLPTCMYHFWLSSCIIFHMTLTLTLILCAFLVSFYTIFISISLNLFMMPFAHNATTEFCIVCNDILSSGSRSSHPKAPCNGCLYSFCEWNEI